MRTPDHIKLRYIMLNHFEKRWTSGQSYRDLVGTYGEDAISKSSVEKWFARFKSGDTDVEDKEGRGRKSEFDDEALLEAIEEDESQTTRMCSCLSRSSVKMWTRSSLLS
jgi:[histone H3]-lysine36 N-dimethyltransferase SETMAR